MMSRRRTPISLLLSSLSLAVGLVYVLSATASCDTIKMGGSGTNLGTMRLLAEAFQNSVLPEFSGPSRRQDSFVILPSIGSGGGVKALLAGAIDIALTSRPLKDRERRSGVVAIEYGRTPLVLVTAKRDSPPGVTTQQLVDIYSGNTITWPDGSRLRLVLRPERDSDTIVLKSMGPDMHRAVQRALSRKGMKFATTDQENASAIETIAGALGTSTLALIVSKQRAVRVLSLDGIRPSPQTIADGTYPYFKRLFLVIRPETASALVKQFVAFVRSEAGRTILAQTGHWVLTE